MSEPFLGQIKMFAGNFAPRSYAFCDGQLLQIVQYTALFSLLGTTYGGDGKTTFALPNLQGRAPMHAGSGPGLSPHRLGESGGSETATLTEAQMPSHTHLLGAVNQTSTSQAPSGNALSNTAYSTGRGGTPTGTQAYGVAGNLVSIGELGSAGAGAAHGNVQPRLGINYIISLQGIYPQRS
jgi:microcystin-dependent protein